MTICNNSGIRLKTARLAAGFKSAKQFCAKYDIPSSTYSLHETGGRSIKPKTAEKYAGLLGVNAAWVLTGVGSPFDAEFEDSSPISDREFIELLQYHRSNKKTSLSTRGINSLVTVNPYVFSTIVTRMAIALNQLSIPIDEKNLSGKAVAIYNDITQSSAIPKDQLTMIDLSMTTFKREAKESQKNKDINE